jgi:hypothetical protein
MGSSGFLTNAEGSFSIHVSKGDGVRPNRRIPQADDASSPETVPAKRRIFVEAVCCKLETGGNAKGNPQKCKGEIPGIAKGH